MNPLATLAPARRRQVVALLAVVLVLVIALGAWQLLRPGPDPVDQASPGPVVIVPGYGGDVGSVERVRQALRESGREVRVLEPLGDGTGDLREQAEGLRDLVDGVLEESEGGSVDLVGYSAGGVVSRLYVRDLGGDDVVRRVLTLGSPHHGTDSATLALQAAGSCPEACEQLAIDSDLLRELNAGDETPEGPLWTTLRSSDDEVVTPVDSAVLAGALNVLVQDVCADSTTSHGALPGDPVTEALLGSALGAAEPAAPTGARC